MPAPQFLSNYPGTKYRESPHTDKIGFDYSKINTIVEPFGGTFGFSRYVYYKLGHTHINFKVYDTDNELIDFLNYVKKLVQKDEQDNFLKEYRDAVADLENECMLSGTKYLSVKKLTEYFKKFTHENPHVVWLIYKNHYNKPTPQPVYKNNAGFFEIFKNCEFVCGKFEDIPQDVLEEKNTLVYLDPPYIKTDNSYYDTQFDFNTIFEKIEWCLLKTTCVFVHQYNFLLFRTFRHIQNIHYDKQYGRGKRVTHILFYNLNTPEPSK